MRPPEDEREARDKEIEVEFDADMPDMDEMYDGCM